MTTLAAFADNFVEGIKDATNDAVNPTGLPRFTGYAEGVDFANSYEFDAFMDEDDWRDAAAEAFGEGEETRP